MAFMLYPYFKFIVTPTFYCVSDPPDENILVEQKPPGPVDTGSTVQLSCSVNGGNPLPSLSWDCGGNKTTLFNKTTSVFLVEFIVNKNQNGKLCKCSATHPISSYKPSAQLELVVYCKFCSHSFI